MAPQSTGTAVQGHASCGADALHSASTSPHSPCQDKLCPGLVPAMPCACALALLGPPGLLSQETAASESLRGTWEVDAPRDTGPVLSRGYPKGQSKLVAGAQPAAWLPWPHGVCWVSRALPWLPLLWYIHCKYLLQYIFI